MAHTYHYKPARYFTKGRRGLNPSLVVVHCTQGSTAAGAAGWFQNPAAGGSAHIVVDDTEVYRCVHDRDTAWHAKGHNTIGLGLEIVGFAQWSAEKWMSHKPTLIEAARIHAGWNKKYGIPFVWSTSRGYHSHDDLPGNDHYDPGPNFPWAFYRQQVRRFMEDKPDRAKLGRTLRLILPDGRRLGGWTKDEVPKGYNGPALGAMKWIKKNRRVPLGTVFTWNGVRREDPDWRVIATVLNNNGPR